METKTCNVCNFEKNVLEFHKRNDYKEINKN